MAFLQTLFEILYNFVSHSSWSRLWWFCIHQRCLAAEAGERGMQAMATTYDVHCSLSFPTFIHPNRAHSSGVSIAGLANHFRTVNELRGNYHMLSVTLDYAYATLSSNAYLSQGVGPVEAKHKRFDAQSGRYLRCSDGAWKAAASLQAAVSSHASH